MHFHEGSYTAHTTRRRRPPAGERTLTTCVAATISVLLAVIVFSSWGLQSGCNAITGGRLDSGTHWLTACEFDTECGDSRCVCGVCTDTCETAASCVEDAAECLVPTGAGRQECAAASFPTAALCLANCATDAECIVLRDDLICRDGLCLPGPTVPADDMACTPEMCGTAPMVPERLCDDGSGAGPRCVQAFDGDCGWVVTTCDDFGCYTQSDCAPGTRCNANELCLPDPQCSTCSACFGLCLEGELECGADASCEDDDICENGTCIPPECGTAAECETGQICIAGRCEPAECTTDNDCPAREVCEGGLCENPQCTDVDEPVCDVAGETWLNACRARVARAEALHVGECVAACDPSTCGPVPGVQVTTCTDGSRAGPFCVRRAEERCTWEIMACPDSSVCSDDADCGDGETCTAADFCVDHPNGAAAEPCYGWCDHPGRICSSDECGATGDLDTQTCDDGSSAAPLCRRDDPESVCSWRAAFCSE